MRDNNFIIVESYLPARGMCSRFIPSAKVAEVRGTVMETLSRDKVHDFLRALNGKFFTVEFIKRTTGEVRSMRATTNYTSKLAGGDLKYDADAKKLIPVWDMDKQGFRSIPTDAVLIIKALGNTYSVTD